MNFFRKRLPTSFCLLFLFVITTWGQARTGTDPLEGNWLGTIKVRAVELRLLFIITAVDGTLTGSMDSIDQGVVLPMTITRLDGGKVLMENTSAAASFEGGPVVNNTIEGKWSQQGQSRPMTLERVAGKPAGPSLSKELVARIKGTWEGPLSANGAQLRLRFNVMAGDAGQVKCSLDSIDQGAMGIPAEAQPMESGIRFKVRSIGVAYEGRFNENGKTLSGKWTQNGQVFNLELKKAGE